MPAGAGGPPAPAAVPGVPGMPVVPGPCSVRWISSLVGVGVAQPVVGSTGETWLRWRFPSPVASSRRPGSSTGLPRFSRFWTRFFFRPLLVAPSLEVPQRGSACCFG